MYLGKHIKQHHQIEYVKAKSFLEKSPGHVPLPPPLPQIQSQSDNELNQLLDLEVQIQQKNKQEKSEQTSTSKEKESQKRKERQSTIADYLKVQYEYSMNSNGGEFERKNVKQKKPKKAKKSKSSEIESEFSIPPRQAKQNKENLTGVQILKSKQPATKNYRIGKKQQWESNKGIEDYKLIYVLRKFPKIQNFKNNQKAIIKCSLLGNDVFVCMPTGGGKSLTFQTMTYIQKGIYLCILPLVSLIFDQQFQAKKLGIKAISLTGGTDARQNRKIIDTLQTYEPGNESIVVFCTPQKLNKSPQFFGVLKNLYEERVLVKIVIDEVHCVSTWGKQFREEYQNLSTLRQSFPKTPILGLTATVTQTIKQDIIKRLKIENCFYFQSSFNRPNLYYEVKEKKKTVLNDIIAIIEKYKNQSGIIYCLSKNNCEEMCKKLTQKNYLVAFYHANIDEKQKKKIQNSWMNNELHIIVATIAFGMGINKPDVRFVIHHSLSKSLENYYQESGRAGRDGQFAQCILFYGKSDKIGLQNLILKNDYSNYESKNFCMNQLSNMVRYCEDRFECRRKFQLSYLGQTDFDVSECNGTCDNCKKGYKYVDFECIDEGKSIVNFLMGLDQIKENMSQNQMIQLLKGNKDKKNQSKLKKIQQELNLSDIKSLFLKWSKSQIDELITYLLSFQIIQQKIVFIKLYKKGKVGVLYLKPNYTIGKKFLREVQTLTLKRKKNEKGRVEAPTHSQQMDVEFEEMGQFIENTLVQYQFGEQDNNTKLDYNSIPESFFEDL